jgi:hypothetical protein
MLRWKTGPDGNHLSDFRAPGQLYSKRFAFTASEPGDFASELRKAGV